jgi:multidrug efflux pump subunit AcrB
LQVALHRQHWKNRFREADFGRGHHHNRGRDGEPNRNPRTPAEFLRHLPEDAQRGTPAGAQVTPLIGREHELSMLLGRWEQSKDGEGQVVLLTGPARFLFIPLAITVVLAMLASYFLSRTVVPTMVHYLLPAEAHLHQEGHTAVDGGWIWAVHQRFNHHFTRLQTVYRRALAWSLDHAKVVVAAFAALVVLSVLSLFPLLGMDFFPNVDAGQFRLHVRCPAGTRIEETEVRYAEVEAVIRETIPPDEIQIVINNIGIPGGGVNLAFSDTSILSGADGEILVALNPEKHAPTPSYIERLRTILPQRFPDLVFFFQPADMVSQILNFGLPAPIDVQVIGRDPKNVEVARDLVRRIAAIPGAVDVRLQQVVDTPTIGIDVDRRLAKQLGFTERDVASSLLVSLSGIAQIAPSYWLNLKNGVNYAVGVQTPQYRIDSIDALNSTPISVPGLPRPQLLANIAATQRDVQPAVISHYNVQPVLDVLTGVQGADLWSVSSAVERVVDEVRPTVPRGTYITIRGQAEAMRSSFTTMAYGMLLAVVLVYLLMAVNFQSWLDPLIILMALPGALAGVLWILWLTQTNVSVPALLGAIMCIGVATANSNLVVTFANDLRREGKEAIPAALEAGSVRLRPVLMTALAMILGMLPMSLGLGEGGEQNAPLGRVVIGGLLMATFATLFFVPVVYSRLRRRPVETSVDPDLQ